MVTQSQDHCEVIEWQNDKRGFKVKSVRHLENKVLPRYFRHGNYTSFVRQLNMYDFHKVKVEEDSVFAHSELTELSRDLLPRIKRKCYKRGADKENVPESPGLEKLTESLESVEPAKSVDIWSLIDELVESVREEVAAIGGEPRKIVYEMRKMPRFRPIKGAKYLNKIYRALDVDRERAKDDELEELSIEEVILYEDNVLKLNSLAYLRSEVIFVKAETEGSIL